MKLVTLDIETSPDVVYSWGVRKQYLTPDRIIKPSEMMCFAAKWHGSREVEFYSTFWDGKDAMLAAAARILSEAEAVIHYNGTTFDIPNMNKEIAKAGMLPPQPFAQIDLMRVVMQKFRFESYKLDFVAQQLGLGHKVRHDGFDMWVRCLAGDESAWRKMRKYCIGDVRLEDKLYDKILPWITNHPSVPLREGNAEGCPNCGSLKAQRRGYAFTALGAYQQYCCSNCGRWYRGGVRVRVVEGR